LSLRLHVETPLQAGAELALPPAAVRHAQVRRVQPGDPLLLFDGAGLEWPAVVLSVGRQEVQVRLGVPQAVQRELAAAVTLAVGMPANERMDALVEKATELGVARIQPLHTERSVLRLEGERAQRKRAHWQAVAVAACEQCGRARVPQIAPVRSLGDWLPTATAGLRCVLSLQSGARSLAALPAGLDTELTFLSGPEGGLNDAEETAARRCGFVATTLGPRVLRADTAPLAALAWIALQAAAGGPPGCA
jgi:16S rRNA (uracil1498-N3)-methyltransferase